MKPVEASKKKNEEKVYANLYGSLIYLKPENQNVTLVTKVVFQNLKDK